MITSFYGHLRDEIKCMQGSKSLLERVGLKKFLI